MTHLGMKNKYSKFLLRKSTFSKNLDNTFIQCDAFITHLITNAQILNNIAYIHINKYI